VSADETRRGKGLWHIHVKSSTIDVNMANSTRTSSEIVRQIIETDGVIKYGMARGLINIRALARYIQVETGGATTFEAIVSAIRRYPIKETSEKRMAIGRMITKLSMKNKMVNVAIRNDSEAPLAFARFAGEIDYARGETLRVVSGPEAVTLLMDSKNLDKLTSTIPKKSIIMIIRNLAEIIVYHSEAIVRRPGNVAAVTTELAMNDVNMLDCAATYGPPPQIAIVVDEKDALRAYQSLERLSQAEH